MTVLDMLPTPPPTTLQPLQDLLLSGSRLCTHNFIARQARHPYISLSIGLHELKRDLTLSLK